ncbi:MAG: hypothetical protein Q8O70_02725 [Burkholderiales bacterium]|nr:hypothetical protein [Burkholderiales bacterium]
MEPQLSVKAATANAVPADNADNVQGIRRLFRTARSLHDREKSRLRAEIAQIPGLMVLLMKPRNGLRWSNTERRELRIKLRRLSRLSIYLAMAALPFTMFTLPLVAWWLDRRQRKRA